MDNGFDEYKRVILSKIDYCIKNADELKEGQKDHTKKLEELRIMFIERFGKIETSITVMKTKMAFILIAISTGVTIGINLLF